MNYIPPEEREKLFKEAIDKSYTLWRKKDNENAFRAIAKANLYLPDFTDQFNYLFDLMKIKDMSAVICKTDKNPDYEAYLIFSLETHALDIARDLLPFPLIPGFYYRKKVQYSPYSYNAYDNFEISPEDDEGWNLALKELNLFKHRKEMIDEYLKFIYEELPIIYGIPPEFNEETMKSIKFGTDEWNKYYHRLASKLNNKPIDFIPYEIYNFIIKLIKKYHDLGSS